MSGGTRILVADEICEEGMEILRAAGEVRLKNGLTPSALKETLPGIHALVVRSATQVTAQALEGADRLIVIGRAGIGVDNIDVAAATARGIVVMNTPESGATTTGELAIALMLALARNAAAADHSIRQGKWEKSRFSGVEITGKTLGVVGMGRIGRVVADRALGLKMRVLGFDPYVKQERAPQGVLMVPFDRLLAESDFVSIHVPLLDSTKHLIDEKAFAQMKPGSRLIHCARGGIVKETALLKALQEKRIAGAALDVFEQEPIEKDHPLLKLDNVILTPHLGASTEEARRAVGIDIAREVVECLKTGTVVNGVNVPHIHPSEAEFLAPFLTLGERLASMLMQLHPGHLESIRVVTQGEVGEHKTLPIQVAAMIGALRHVCASPVTPVNAQAIAREKGIACEASHSTLKKDFVNLVRVELSVGGEPCFATGTLIGLRHLRMVELDHFLLDAIPEGHLLVTRHRDVPGVIGRLGTLLGEAGVNISRLQLGLERPRRDRAIGILNVDGEVPPPVLARLRTLPEVETVTAVTLEV